jgi:3-hydroxyacyl-CoA dehydrogenase/enoyl-CoA hydratase/carnithine racemase
MSKIFSLTVENDGIGYVTINVVGEAMNTWTDATFKNFAELMDELEITPNIKGLIFISGKPDNFFAGANLNTMSKLDRAEDVRQLLELFQGSFNRLNAFHFPTVAAINGYCLGGGLEFALACTGRIVKEGKSALLGLPECTVGLFPGGGGTQRLPRLIGYPAIDLILKGRMIKATEAHKMLIVDRLVPVDGDLLAEAKKFLLDIINGKAELNRPIHDFSQIDDVAEKARLEILKINKGRYIPGLMLALDSMQEGLKVSLKEGIEIEKTNMVKVVLSNQAKGSINTFFLKGMTDKPKTMMSKGFKPLPLNKAAILGFGTMGRGIAIEILRNTNIPLIVKDVPEALEQGRSFIRKILSGMADKGRLKEPMDSIMARLQTVSEYTEDFRNVDLVVEAVFEDIEVKGQVYNDLCKVVRDNCVITSNTSSLSVTAMAKYVTHPERFGGTHFFSPAWLMQLVEIIQGEQTSTDTIDNLLNFIALIKKRPIICRDNEGFVVNALLHEMLLVTYHFLEEGNSIEKVDKAMIDFGMPVGPIRLTDEVGIDVPYKIFKGMGIRQQTIINVVEVGRLGLKKSGKGFFLKDGSVDPEVLPLIAKSERRELTPRKIQEENLIAMVKAGKDLLDRKVVDDVRMIDAGMIWGIGFPADKGGPMKWADLTGLSKHLFKNNFYGE